MKKKWRVTLGFLGTDAQVEVQAEASCPELATAAVTRHQWIEAADGVFYPSRNVTFAKVEELKEGVQQ